MTKINGTFLLLQMNIMWGSRIISVLEMEIQSNHTTDSVVIRNNVMIILYII